MLIPQVGDLVARRDIVSEEIKLGYISRTTELYGFGYYVYFFDWNKRIWVSEKEASNLKSNLESWKTNGQLPIS
jgi:hypothetical protein